MKGMTGLRGGFCGKVVFQKRDSGNNCPAILPNIDTVATAAATAKYYFQTGFRQYYSTQTSLLKLVDDIRAGNDRKKVTLLS